MKISQHISLRPYHTFRIDVYAQQFATFTNTDELGALLDEAPGTPLLILGGGSNMLFTHDVEGWVLKNEIKGIAVVKEEQEYVYVRAGAGESWHQLVMHCVNRGWAGIENLSLIPGCAGASPMQNIGAYGVEIRDVFHSLTAFHIRDKKVYNFTLSDCGFGYRESVFKRRYKGEFVITDITLRLSRQPVFRTSYGAIQQELEKMGVQELSIKAISDAVIRIRSSKLPDPEKTGNAGSFFKNPSVPAAHFQALQQQHPGIVGYSNDDDTVKLAAGWLIEHSGPQEGVSWKGYRSGDAGVHPAQALVLVNYGSATGQEIFSLSEKIVQSVKNKFNVALEREVNII